MLCGGNKSEHHARRHEANNNNNNNNFKKIKSVAYSSQGSHTGQLATGRLQYDGIIMISIMLRQV